MRSIKLAAAALAAVFTAVSAVCVPAAAELITPGEAISLVGDFGADKMHYSDEMFAGSSKKYSQDIALFSAILAASEYVVEDGALMSQNRLTSLGFDTITDFGSHRRVWELTADDPDYAGYTFAHRKITAGGKSFDLVSVAVKGTSSNYEWLSNFDVGTGLKHMGFYTACGRLEDDLNAYVRSLSIEPENVKIHICGHSRGAAVANMLAEDIINSADKLGDRNKIDTDWFGKVKAENVYAYLFAPPTTEKNDSITADVRSESAKYAGIYNFIDPRDPITQMPLYGWGFSRAGKQIPLPSLITAGSIANEIYTDKMDGLFDSFGFGNYSDNMEPYADSNTVYVFSELSGYIKSADEYYSKQCGSEDSDIITAYKFFHDGIAAAIANSSEDTTSLISTIAVGASTEELYGLTNYFIRNSIDGSLVFTHMPQNYIAGVMQLKTTDDLLRGDYYHVNIEPALNVTVRNADNNAVGQVKDGAAVQYSQGVYSNGTDIDIYLPEDEKFTVSMTGRGSEKVTVTVYRENAVTGRIKESYSIKDISAEAGTKLGLTLKEDGSSILGVLRDLEEGAPYSEIYRASFTEPVTVGDPDEADNEDKDDGSVTVDDDSAPTPAEDDGPSVTEDNAPTDDDTDAPAQTYPEPAQTYPEPDAFITDDPDPDGNPPTGTTLPTAAIAALITAAASRKRSR